MKVFSYLQIFPDDETQDTNKDKKQIRAFAKKKGFPKVEIITEELKKKVQWKKRRIKDLVNRLQKNDKLILLETHMLGKSILEVMEILAVLKERKVGVYDIINGWELDNINQSRITSLCFQMGAKIEKDLMVKRCAAGVKAARARGVKFGRPVGSGRSKLDKHRAYIERMLAKNCRYTEISKEIDSSYSALIAWLKRHKLSRFKDISQVNTTKM